LKSLVKLVDQIFEKCFLMVNISSLCVKSFRGHE